MDVIRKLDKHTLSLYTPLWVSGALGNHTLTLSIFNDLQGRQGLKGFEEELES